MTYAAFEMPLLQLILSVIVFTTGLVTILYLLHENNKPEKEVKNDKRKTSNN